MSQVRRHDNIISGPGAGGGSEHFQDGNHLWVAALAGAPHAMAAGRSEGPSPALVVFIALTSPAIGQDIVGQASGIDGDTIEIHSQRSRLWCSDAPESDHRCGGADR